VRADFGSATDTHTAATTMTAIAKRFIMKKPPTTGLGVNQGVERSVLNARLGEGQGMFVRPQGYSSM